VGDSGSFLVSRVMNDDGVEMILEMSRGLFT
jgi:hypothetical protein